MRGFIIAATMRAHHILFIAPNRIGDAVLASSLLTHILATDPLARVTLATSPLAAPLFAGFPALERVILVNKRSYNRHWVDLWRATFGTRWHAVWDVRGSVLSFLLRMRHRHYYVPPKTEDPKIKQYEQAFGIANLPYPTLWPRSSDTQGAAQLLPADGRTLIFAPIANWETKEWPLTHFIALAQHLLHGAYAGYRPVIICAAHERPRALAMLEALADYAPIDLTRGEHDLLTLYACMQRAQGFVGNDSGLMHMAAAAGIPTLGLFGPTPSTIYQPWGEHAEFLHAPGNDLKALTPATVAARVEHWLAKESLSA